MTNIIKIIEEAESFSSSRSKLITEIRSYVIEKCESLGLKVEGHDRLNIDNEYEESVRQYVFTSDIENVLEMPEKEDDLDNLVAQYKILSRVSRATYTYTIYDMAFVFEDTPDNPSVLDNYVVYNEIYQLQEFIDSTHESDIVKQAVQLRINELQSQL